VNDGATDIHMEPRSDLPLRYRIDGKLRMGPSLPKICSPGSRHAMKILSS
jgi:type II secretory ATPase GspE/PulE/Tfp pilus assembly ATPase PilB-like protein